ncbi:exodeoxyribonuclease V subunit alpha [Vibrio sp. 404]|uniref:RecBCD enzyme subunit RecD n=1 Tax=Vibrio marinisediminis TaxID=2758441 RepID=A0A7W2FU12_9VIBR|nr:exodeoxyribonuclease V subunit alpha [Vibrio marinisediminis]MBA5764236.1 exodeoxyribonuclease V subunit alpha [Vibrio marinisediminis]
MNTLLETLQRLAQKGSIRQLDYQLARFIYSKSQSAELAFITGVISSELGKGHICLPLADAHAQPTDLAAKLGLFGEAALELNQQLIAVDWQALLTQSIWVAKSYANQDGSHHVAGLPLVFDGERVYLHRYWHYEVTLAERLVSFGTPMILKPTDVQKLSELLDHLFARSYHFLYSALSKASQLGGLTQVQRQQMVCDHLDVVDNSQLDWSAIEQVLLQATRAEQLSPLDELVPQSVCVNWQKVAAAIALTKRFAVISGGPGTGKTTTVTKLLAALIEQAQHVDSSAITAPTIKLVAPTGKAAARLTESIGKAVAELPVSPELKAAIPTESSTIHRLLGALPNSAEFRHNQSNPLHLDILVVDEASMVDLSMMYKLVDALPKHARLILLGDKDQLASVEAGAVLGDICSFSQYGYSATQGDLIAQLSGYSSLANSTQKGSRVGDSLCMLQKSYRFDARSGIGQLAKAVNSGSAFKLDAVWQRDFDDIAQYPLDMQHYNQLIQTMVSEYGGYLKRIAKRELNANTQQLESVTELAKAGLDAFAKCRLLCAIREGDFGVNGLNQRIERALVARKLIQTQDELWYHGRPVMITRNDHALGLYNGDIGICILDDSLEEPRLKVFFELPDGSVKSVLPSRVPEHETAYAMTIHKSQGSEFEFTLMILPKEFSPILTRELIYTGITRAKKRLAMYVQADVVKRGIKVMTERASGLAERLKS